MINPEDITKSFNDIKAEVVSRIDAGKVEDALALFDDRTKEVEQAYKEYNPKYHSIMFRPDKVRKNKSDYFCERGILSRGKNPPLALSPRKLYGIFL